VKYRHSFHAGNFADIHKHVTLLALLASLKRKDKGFAYIETHAGRGSYDIGSSPEAAGGAGKFSGGHYHAVELVNFAALLARLRHERNRTHLYPGSPLIAASELREQDRALFCEISPPEARALEREVGMRVECADGFERLRGWLPPKERRALVFIDPPYEETHRDFDRVTATLADSLQRFSTGVYAVWYPIKDQREIRSWHDSFARSIQAETLASEMWLYPRDSKVALNGSGLLIVNPPYQLDERMGSWLPELQARLDVGHSGGIRITRLASP
jgi:23S rRNA (adenine2030-N6)-methyltransferase